MIRRIALTTLTIALGCGVKNVGELDSGNVTDPGETDASTGGESSASSASASSASASSASTSSDSMTSVSTDPPLDDSGSDEDSGSGTGGGCASMCGPHENQQTDFVIDADEGPGENLFDVPCVIRDNAAESGTMELECMEDGSPVTHAIDIHLSDSVYVNLAVDQEVLFSWVLIQPFWTEHYFTLRTPEGELVVAGGTGGTLEPAEGFYDPLDPAEVIPMCGADDCATDCFSYVRTAIEFQTGNGGEVVLDGNASGNDGDYLIRVGESESRFDFSCTDIPSIWHSWIVERITAI